MTAPTPAAATPVARPATLVSRRHLAIGSPVHGPLAVPPGAVAPGTGVPSTGVPSSGVPSSGVPGSGVPGTGAPSTSAPGRSYPRVGSWHLTGETGHYLVGDRAEFVGPFLRRRLALIPRAENQNLVTLLGEMIAEVQHEVIEVDGAGDRHPPSPGLEQAVGVGGEPRDALVVAERQHAEH